MSGPSAGEALRSLLDGSGVTIAPGVTDALGARLVEHVGFDLAYLTGGGTAQARLASPDIGLVTMTEMVNNAATLVDAISIPLIADADTGHGNALNVMRTIREFERAGVAGVHLEDQVQPKKCGHFAGKALITPAEHAAKIRAACDARRDDDFVVIARTDALSVEGLNAALERGRLYLEAGADVLFVEGLRTTEQLKIVADSFDCPLLYNMAGSGLSPFISKDELAETGDAWKLMIMPNFILNATIRSTLDVLTSIRETGSAADAASMGVPWNVKQELVRLDHYQELETRYGVPEAQRTSIVPVEGSGEKNPQRSRTSTK